MEVLFGGLFVDLETIAVQKHQLQTTCLRPSGDAVWSLASLLAPVSLECFGDVYWGRELLHITREVSGFYDGLIALTDLERYFSLGELFQRHSVQAVSQRWGRDEGSPTSLGDINERLHYGDSLRLRRMECLLDPSAPIVALAREIELTLQHPLNSLSCYITPVGASGLGPHHDETEIFTLQIEGTKRWQLFHRVQATEPAMYDRTELGEPSLELELCPGDLLYLPSGWVHDVSSDEASFSITMVFDPFRWTAVLDALGERLRSISPMLETMPMGVALGDNAQAGFHRQLKSCLKIIRDDLDNFEGTMLVDMLASRLLSRMNMPPTHAVSDMLRLDQMTPVTLVQRRRDVACHLARRTDTIALMLPGGQVIDAPSSAEPAFRAIIESDKPFRVTDVHASLDEAASMSLVRVLIGAGLLEVVNDNGG